MLAALFSMDVLWRNALIAVPVAVLVAVICRVLPCRPATRHMLWLVVLVVLFAPAGVPRIVPAHWMVSGNPGGEAPAPSSEKPADAAPPALRVPEIAPSHSQSDSPGGAAALGGTRRNTTAVESHAPAWRESAVAHPRADRAPARHSNDYSGARTASESRPAPQSQPVEPFFGARDAVRLMGPLPALDNGLLERMAVAPMSGRPDLASPPATAVLKPSELPATSRTPAETPTAAPRSAESRGEPAADRTVASEPSLPWRAMVAPAVEQAKQWVARMRPILDAVASLPALPSGLWLIGSVGLAVIATVRVFGHRRMLRHATPAPAPVEVMVADAARALGLRRAPQTLMVSARVSPMIWCGRRARLLLPHELWEELDEVGQQAVIHHELAHLKRRDHWVCWAELLASALYWWHPLVWFVRRRLREEADLCCDAWVTMLFPRARRAYAQALLDTRRFISEAKAAPPSVGLGATTGRARHFARRLTMVMTQRMTPRGSVPGIFMAITLATAGVLAAPLLACPPEDGKDSKSKATVVAQPAQPAEAPRAPRAPRAPKAPYAVTTPVPPAPPAMNGLPPGAAVAGGVPAPRPGAAAISTPRARVAQGLSAPRTPAPAGVENSARAEELDARMRRLEQRLDQLNRRMDQMIERMDRHSEGPATVPQLLGTTDPFSAAPLAAVSLTQNDDGRAVVVIVGPGDKVQAYRLDEEHLEGLRAKLAGSGEPVDVQRRSVEAAKELYGMAGRLGGISGDHARALADQARALEEYQRAMEAQHSAMGNAHRDLARALAAQARERSHVADRLRERAESLDGRAESLADRLEQERELAESLRGASREAHVKMTEDMRAQLEALRAAVRQLTEQAETLSNQAEEISDNAEEQGEESSADDSADDGSNESSCESAIVVPAEPAQAGEPAEPPQAVDPLQAPVAEPMAPPADPTVPVSMPGVTRPGI